MIISEFVRALNIIKNKHGDIHVHVWDETGTATDKFTVDVEIAKEYSPHKAGVLLTEKYFFGHHK